MIDADTYRPNLILTAWYIFEPKSSRFLEGEVQRIKGRRNPGSREESTDIGTGDPRLGTNMQKRGWEAGSPVPSDPGPRALALSSNSPQLSLLPCKWFFSMHPSILKINFGNEPLPKPPPTKELLYRFLNALCIWPLLLFLAFLSTSSLLC